MRREIRLSGSGGQGIILAGIVLAEAAAVHDGFEVVQTQSYGPEARGGASRAEVIISDEPIDYPRVVAPDVVLVMSQEACDRYGSCVAPGGVVVVDSTNVRCAPVLDRGRVVALPITEIARRDAGSQVTANMVALGALVGVAPAATPQAVLRAIEVRVPRGTEALNLKAFELGLGAARSVMEGGGQA